MTATRQVWRPIAHMSHPGDTGDWSASHLSNPSIHRKSDGTLRVFLSTRGAANRSSTGSVDLALDGDRAEFLGGLNGPHFSPGARGSFDADGVTLSQTLSHEGRLYGFYLGWTVLKHVPFTNFIGLCISDDDGDSFERVQDTPVLGRGPHTPFTVGYPCILPDTAGWVMWFGNHRKWGPEGLEMEHVLSSATSTDLIHWRVDDAPAIDLDPTRPEEFAISRPCALPLRHGGFEMWFAVRAPGYHLGYARAVDGRSWVRDDAAVTFEGAPAPWEDRERTYPWVFDHGPDRYMLYNGNGYGREGFGIARLVGTD